MIGKNIVIAGAGPSGLAASIALARAGFKVEIQDQGLGPASRFRGGFQVLDDYSFKERAHSFLTRTGIPDSFILSPLTAATFFTPDGIPHTMSSAEPYSYLLTRGGRGSLDAVLTNQAVEEGVRIRYGVRAERADIIATGPRQVDGVSLEWHFETDDKLRIWVYFNPKHCPGGYSYLFTCGNRGTFGTAITRDFHGLRGYFDQCRRFFRNIEDLPMKNVRTGHSYMNFMIKRSAVLAGRPYIGEAGGFQDFLYGLGLRQALLTGNLAAQSIIEDISYDRLWKEYLGPMPQVSLVNRFLYESMGARGLISFIKRAEEGDLRTYLSKWIKGGIMHRVLFPFIAFLWKNRGTCSHHRLPHWCRKA